MRGYANTATAARLLGTHTGTHRAEKEGSHRFSTPPPPSPGKTGGGRAGGGASSAAPGRACPPRGCGVGLNRLRGGWRFFFRRFLIVFSLFFFSPHPSLRLQSGGCACVLVHRVRRGAMKRGRCKSCSGSENTYRRSPWDGGPVQALKKKKKNQQQQNKNQQQQKANNNTKILGTLKRPASKSIGCSIVQLGVSLFASLYYLCI